VALQAKRSVHAVLAALHDQAVQLLAITLLRLNVLNFCLLLRTASH
jgi:hypothetical protein